MAAAQLIGNLWATPPSAEYYWQQQSQDQQQSTLCIKLTSSTKHQFWFVVSIVILLVLFCIVHCLCKVFRKDDESEPDQEQEQDVDLDLELQLQQQQEEELELDQEQEQEQEQDISGEGGTLQWQQEQQPAEAATSASVAEDLELAQAPALVCTFQAADGWGENTCSVCLANLVDGDTVGVLPACMHYFHAECVYEWLSEHATCPLCRGSTFVFAAVKARRHQRT